MITRSDLQLIESELIAMAEQYLQVLANETQLNYQDLVDIHRGNSFVTALSYSGLQRIQSYFTANPPFDTATGEPLTDLEPLRLQHPYRRLMDDLQTVIHQYNLYNDDEINAFSPIWIERNPQMQPGEGYRAIVRYFLPQLGGMPTGEVTLQPALVGDVLEEMDIMRLD